MKKFSPPQMKEVSFPTPHTPHPTPYTPHPTPHHPRAMFTGIKLVKRDTKLLELPKTSI
jgi:DNA gyrase subunit A